MKAIAPAWYSAIPEAVTICATGTVTDGLITVSDEGLPTAVEDAQAGWGPPGAAEEWVKRALIVLVVGVPLSTVLFVL